MLTFAGKYTYKVDARQGSQVISLQACKTSVRIRTSPGETYTIDVQAMTNDRVFAEGRVQLKAGLIDTFYIYIRFLVFNYDEINRLYEKAIEYVGTMMHRFEIMYRCKPKVYFDDIQYRRAGVMEKYEKDNNGQAASLINGFIHF